VLLLAWWPVRSVPFLGLALDDPSKMPAMLSNPAGQHPKWRALDNAPVVALDRAPANNLDLEQAHDT
jgi:hypothetical protein